MEKSSVRIINFSPYAPELIASAGRMSTTKNDGIEIFERAMDKSLSENLKTIEKVITSGHTSVLEHVYVTLAFKDVSMAVEQFMIEHRLAAFTVKSRRYVDAGTRGCFMPEFYGKNAGKLQELYEECMDYIFKEHEEFAKEIPIEDARFVLPFAFRSNFYCTLNLRKLCDILIRTVYDKDNDRVNAELGRIMVSLCGWIKKELPCVGDYMEKMAGKYQDCIAEKHHTDMEILHLVKGRENVFTYTDGDEVEILADSDSPEETICRAHLMQLGVPEWETVDLSDKGTQEKILKNILSVPYARKRELEQVNFRVLFRHMSLPEITHIERHRMHSLVLPSFVEACRYDKFVIPESIKQAGLLNRYVKVFKTVERYRMEMESLGLDKRNRSYLLLCGMTLPVQTSINANELYVLLRLRICRRAQWEIRIHSMQLLKKLHEKHPLLFSMYGPACVTDGICPEGSKSCGNPPDMKAEMDMEAAKET